MYSGYQLKKNQKTTLEPCSLQIIKNVFFHKIKVLNSDSVLSIFYGKKFIFISYTELNRIRRLVLIRPLILYIYII